MPGFQTVTRIDVLANVRQRFNDRAFRKRQNKTVISVFFRPAQVTYAGQNRGRADGDDHDASHTSYSPPFPVLSLETN
jgi:hypothetical protein